MDHSISHLNCSLQLKDSQRSFRLEVDLQLYQKELLALTGPSGSGKTTILRILAGLEKRAKGRLMVQGELWQDSAQGFFLAPQQRSIGVVFQDYALFPNMSVVQNLQFALPKTENQALIEELLEVMDLQDLKTAYPRELSGGQQQRVALARALVRRPKLLLLDEPLSALDTQMREHLQAFIRLLHERYALTTLLISHHPEEIQRLADRVLVLEKGKIISENLTPEMKPTGLLLRAIWLTPQNGLIRVQLGDNELQISEPVKAFADYLPGQEVWIRMVSAERFEVCEDEKFNR
jgi:molybdate transport system ATP-binding protein